MERRTFLTKTLAVGSASLFASGLVFAEDEKKPVEAVADKKEEAPAKEETATKKAVEPKSSNPKGWNEEGFGAKNLEDALKAIKAEKAEKAAAEGENSIKIKAPDIAENGAVVPVTVSSTSKKVESISILAANNPTPLAAYFVLGEGVTAMAATRIKMGKTGSVIAIVKTTDGKVYKAHKDVKVTIGGCGG